MIRILTLLALAVLPLILLGCPPRDQDKGREGDGPLPYEQPEDPRTAPTHPPAVDAGAPDADTPV